jgi:hypothetical protein
MKRFLRYIYLTVVCTALSVTTGCYGDLEPESYSEINPSIFPKTEKDLEVMVMTCYNVVRDIYAGTSFANMNDCTTEQISGIGYPWEPLRTLSFVPSTYMMPDLWIANINKISRCTNVMGLIEESEMSAELKTRYIAEIRCARGFLSYLLFDMFGPLVIAPAEVLANPLKDQPLARLTNEAMVKFIEDDLLMAAENLPAPSATEYGRFSSGLAKMLLIRLYLHQTPQDKTYYDKVETLAREMMTMGYELHPSYPNLFEKSGQSSNKEYIYVIPFSYEDNYGNSWFMSCMPPNIDGPVQGWGMLKATWWWYDRFEEHDTRKTYIITEYTTPNGLTINRANPGINLELGPVPLKWQLDTEVLANGGLSDYDYVIFRYADVLLSLSEAIVMKPGGSVTQEAIDLMNEVRNRAGLGNKKLADFPTKDAFIDQLLNERSHEFWCENGQYRADLIRFDKLVDRVKELNGGTAPYANRDKYLYPLPTSVIIDGKGLVLQNPGYNE